MAFSFVLPDVESILGVKRAPKHPFTTQPVTPVHPSFFERPVEYIIAKAHKVDTAADHALDAIGTTVGAVNHTVIAIDNVISGKSHFLVYAGIAVVAVVILPVIFKKVL